MSPLSLLLFARRQDNCPDKTPDAVNWGNPTWDIGDASGTVSSEQITGTSCGIRIRVEITWPPLPEDEGGASNSELWIKVTASEITTVSGTPGDNGFTQVSNNDEFVIQNNEWVSFMSLGSNSDSKNIDSNVTIVNVSDDDAVLDTFVGQVRD